MSVTSVFTRLHDDALKKWVTDPENFHEADYLDCESIQLTVEHMAVADLVARAKTKLARKPADKFLFRLIVGTVGTSITHDGDCPRVITARDVARANRMMTQISGTDLRAVYDLDRLKADCREIEDWLWEAFGPTVLDDRLIPMFDKIKGFFYRAAERKQQVVVSWF